MKRHLSYSICFLAVAGLAFISRDGWREERTVCPNHELASRLTEEHRVHGFIDTTKYPAVKPAFIRELVASNAGVCLISESVSGSLQSRPAFLYREGKTGRYYLIFDCELGKAERAGFGPIDGGAGSGY